MVAVAQLVSVAPIVNRRFRHNRKPIDETSSAAVKRNT